MKKKIKQRKVHSSNKSLSKFPPILQRIYAARGIETENDLRRQLTDLISPEKFSQMDIAVERIAAALHMEERILIVGDFDADGATSSALSVSALKQLGAKHVDFLVPNRFEYGYGLTPEIVNVAKREKDPDLIITVDNGISSISGVDTANALGIDVVVTDHHLPGESLPNAIAIVNPNQKGCEFTSKNLAGVGVIFYVMLALRQYLVNDDWFTENNIQKPNMANLLDLVALGTVADVVPLDRNNRILVHQGLQRIRAGKTRPGIQALLEISQRNPQQLVASDLGFAIGPRLNAAGRLDDMSLGIECLLSDDIEQAKLMAESLNELNIERRTIEEGMRNEAMNLLAKLSFNNEQQLPLALVLYDPSWHQGVIGILAGRIKDKFNRPVFAFAKESENIIKASARSIPGLHIRDLLAEIVGQHPDLITKFGGHAMAAGLSMPLENFEKFRTVLQKTISTHLSENDLCGEILSDGSLTKDELTLELAEMLRESGPWGQAFPEPIFDGEFNIVEQRIVGGKHLKLTLTMPGSQRLINAIHFNIEEGVWPNHRCQKIHAAYKLDVNYFRGNSSLQLMIEHLEPAKVELKEEVV